MVARATVEVLENGTSHVVAVPRDGLTIGRGHDQKLVLASRSVSAAHAILRWEGDDLFLVDLESSFGTRRDGVPLHGPTLLADGDEVVLGRSAVLRVSLFGAGFGAPLDELSDAFEGAPAATAPGDVQPLGIDLLPIVESLFRATSAADLGQRIANAALEHFRPSRVAVLELEGTGDRYRVLGLAGDGAKDGTFVSRTVVGEAARRGVALYREGDRPRPLASVVRSGAGSAAAAGIRPRDGHVRVVYLDTRLGAPPLGHAHALSLELFAAHASAAMDALAARDRLAEEQRRFEQLRRYFSPAVAEHLLAKGVALDKPQRVHATILFADLVGYTKLSERLRDDPARLLALLNRWLDAGARAVIDHGGTLDKFIGDAVMAVFGAPLSMPDGEVASVRTALAMRDVMVAVSRELGESLAITVGINSGEVVAGSVGNERRLEYTVLGDPVNVAARLQGKAHPGEILAGRATVEQLGGAAEVEPAGVLEVHNHAPVEAFRILRLRA